MTKPYENENLTVTMDRKPGAKVTLDIKISPKAAEAAYHQAIKVINKQVSLPGFRKGKAPESMIISQYQPHIESEWKEIITKTAFFEAIKLVEVYPYSDRVTARPNLKKLDRKEGGELTVEYEATPNIPEIDPAALSLSDIEKKSVTEEQIQNALEDIRYQHAEWTDITDRSVKEDDYIEITIENIETDPPAPLFQQTRFKVDKENMGNWMRKLVIGKNVGDVVEGMSEKETKNESADQSEFKPTHLRITIHKIQTAALPEVNEEFAKKLGLDSIDAIKEKVAKELDGFAEEDRKSLMRNQLSNELIKNYHVDLPSSMIEGEIQRQSHAAVARAKAKAKKDEDVAEKTKSAAEQAALEVENSYKLYFLLQKVANDNKIQPDSQEVMHELMRQMFAINPQERIIDPQGDPKESRARVHAFLVEQKAKDWLIEQAMQKQEKA